MIYVNEGYKNYKYLVSASDNYIILTDQKKAGGNKEYETINIIYQYINPPITIESTKQVWNEINYTKIETSSNLFDRADTSNILTCVFFIILLTFYIINRVTEFVERGGIM